MRAELRVFLPCLAGKRAASYIRDIQKNGVAASPYDRAKFAKYFSGDIKAVSDGEFEALLGRPIPDGHWSGMLDMNDALCQMYYAKGAAGRLAYKILTHFMTQKEEYPPLNERVRGIRLFRSSVRTLDIGVLSFLI